MSIENWLKENTHSLNGKTIAITGSTGALANELVHQLANLGAGFIFINRDEKKTKEQIKKLISLYPNLKVEFIQCDLADFDSVKTATDKLKKKSFDIFYACAGAYNIPIHQTNIGYNNIFQINFLSHYYMINEILPILNAKKGKIVAVGSIAHNYSKLDEKDLDFSNHKKASIIYGNAKRFLMFALFELMKNQETALSIVHPGVTLTEMTNHYPKAINWLIKFGIKLFFPSNKKATLSLIKGFFDCTNYHEWIGPKIFDVWSLPKKKKLRTCSQQESEKIFNIAEKIYKTIK